MEDESLEVWQYENETTDILNAEKVDIPWVYDVLSENTDWDRSVRYKYCRYSMLGYGAIDAPDKKLIVIYR